jgi:hypothetical protein
VTPEKADAKHRAMQREHDDIGMSFSKVIKDMYPDSSKKRIRGSGE